MTRVRTYVYVVIYVRNIRAADKGSLDYDYYTAIRYIHQPCTSAVSPIPYNDNALFALKKKKEKKTRARVPDIIETATVV